MLFCDVSEPTGVRELTVYPLSPTAVILSWQRPYHVAFRKYVLQTFFFNPVTLASEWTTYYEIAATASVIASVVTLAHGRPGSSVLVMFFSLLMSARRASDQWLEHNPVLVGWWWSLNVWRFRIERGIQKCWNANCWLIGHLSFCVPVIVSAEHQSDAETQVQVNYSWMCSDHGPSHGLETAPL